MEDGDGSVKDRKVRKRLDSRSFTLCFRCCSLVCEAEARDEGMNSIREVWKNSSGRKCIQFVGYKATMAPRRSSFRGKNPDNSEEPRASLSFGPQQVLI